VSSGQAAVCERPAAHDSAGHALFPFRGRLPQAGIWKVLRFLTTNPWYLLHCLEVSCRFPMPTERPQEAQQAGRASTILRGTRVLNLPALFPVDGGGGTGKTPLLLLGAHVRRVRSEFHYILVLGLGKVATEAKVLADIADLVDASGGEALAARIRAVPAGENQMQEVVNLTRPWLAKTSVVLLDYV
jgi:hypothetical protein